MRDEFADQTVVVTGGSSGLGWYIAQAFLRHGAYVYLLAREPEKLRAAAERLRRESPRVGQLVADITDDEAVKRAFERVSGERARLNVLVNAAGISHRGAVLETAPEQFQRLWDLNFLGTVRCTRAAVPALLREHGHLVNIGSLASKIASAYLGAYPASKFAVAAYSQQLRLELGPAGLHVLLVCPGPIRREDAGHRYDAQAETLPPAARQPGGGARLALLDPVELAERIVQSCRRRQPELIVPGKVRWLLTLTPWFPAWTERIIRRKTGQAGAP